jgi:DNA-binding MarR family transcriptional regulator
MKFKAPDLDKSLGAMFLAYRGISHKETFFYISRNAGTTPLCNGDLVALTGTSPSTISNRINSLIRQDLIVSTPDPTRRRNQLLTLTTHGKEVAESLIDEVRATVTPDTLVELRNRMGFSLRDIERAENRLILEDKRNSNAS